MLIDFSNEGLVDSIWCSVSESDGYSVKNLISSNKIEKQKGFLVESFIRPPVSVYIKFIEDISIDHIIIISSNGAQITSGLELFTGDSIYVSNFLCKAFLKNETGFLFHRFNDKNLKTSHRNLLKQPFRSSRYSNVRYLKVNIIKTKNSTIPALKRIEIWGSLSSKCSEVIKSKILDVWSKIVKPSEPVIDVKRKETNIESQSTVSTSSNASELVPDEFLDPITFELIVIPMVLPSGKIVDLKTLERYTLEQEKYGRSANDPFTGKYFTEISKPVYSSSLKLRIDEFLSRNSGVDVLMHSSRTVGLPSECAKVCRLVSQNIDRDQNENSSKFSINSSADSIQNRGNIIQINSPTQHTISNAPDKNNLCDSEDNEKSNSKLNINSFDFLKSDSLNASLKQFVSNRTRNSHTNHERNSCSVCKAEENLYQIPCRHYMCRLCTTVRLGKNESYCSICSTPFKSSDIVKTHSSNISSTYRIA